LPEVAESTFQKAKKTFSFGKKLPGRVDEGGLLFIASPHPPSSTFPPLLEGVGSFRDVDSATSPLASRRMTEGGRHPVKMEGFRIRETNKKEVWGYRYRFFIDARYIIYSLIHVLSIEQERFISSNLSKQT